MKITKLLYEDISPVISNMYRIGEILHKTNLQTLLERTRN